MIFEKVGFMVFMLIKSMLTLYAQAPQNGQTLKCHYGVSA